MLVQAQTCPDSSGRRPEVVTTLLAFIWQHVELSFRQGYQSFNSCIHSFLLHDHGAAFNREFDAQ